MKIFFVPINTFSIFYSGSFRCRQRKQLCRRQSGRVSKTLPVNLEHNCCILLPVAECRALDLRGEVGGTVVLAWSWVVFPFFSLNCHTARQVFEFWRGLRQRRWEGSDLKWRAWTSLQTCPQIRFKEHWAHTYCVYVSMYKVMVIDFKIELCCG